MSDVNAYNDISSLTRSAGRSHSASERRRCIFCLYLIMPFHNMVNLHTGGEASISNFRTLCTPCHEIQTAALLSRLAAADCSRAADGSKDIRGYFNN